MNKVKFGLKNVHYSKVTVSSEGVVSYATPVALKGAVNLALSPKGETTPFYADDIEYYTSIVNSGYEGTLELALLNDQFRIDVLGFIKDTNNNIIEDMNGKSSPFALLFEFTADDKAIRHCLYNVEATRPNIESNTKAASAEVKTETLNVVVKPAFDTGYVKIKSSDDTTTASYDAWYTTVPLRAAGI